MGQPTFNPARTRLTCGLSEPGWVQPTFENVEFFSTQHRSNPWWAGLAHGWNSFWHLYILMSLWFNFVPIFFFSK